MKVIFVGPSLPDLRSADKAELVIRPPAVQGNILEAVEAGATAIGLIDGQFETVAPVWHKEILFALSKGIPVLGSSSMGALRAAECTDFGMIGIGRIFDDYRSGRRIEDADVALLHAPCELNYAPLSVPLVNADATLAAATKLKLVSQDQGLHLADTARKLFFKDRTWRRIADLSGLDRDMIAGVVKAAWVDQKRLDALALLAAIRDPALCARRSQMANWSFNATPLWRHLYPISC